MDLIGKTVRWEDREHRPGVWFTARVTGHGEVEGGYEGVVVDPGNYSLSSYSHWPFRSGDDVPNLLPELCTVIDSEPYTDDPECE